MSRPDPVSMSGTPPPVPIAAILQRGLSFKGSVNASREGNSDSNNGNSSENDIRNRGMSFNEVKKNQSGNNGGMNNAPKGSSSFFLPSPSKSIAPSSPPTMRPPRPPFKSDNRPTPNKSLEEINMLSSSTYDQYPPPNVESEEEARLNAENTVLKREIEKKKRSEEDLVRQKQRLDPAKLLIEIETLRNRVKDLETNYPKPLPSPPMAVTSPSRPVPPNADKPPKRDELQLKEMNDRVKGLEQGNLDLRDNLDALLKKSSESDSSVKELNREIFNLRIESTALRKQVVHKEGNLYEAPWEYAPVSKGDLHLHPGDLVQVTLKDTDGWWRGYNFNTEESGIFPSNYVVLKEEEGDFVPQFVENVDKGRVVKSTFDYVARDKDEISFNKGDQIRILQENENGWWFGSHLKTETTGLFPSNFVTDILIT